MFSWSHLGLVALGGALGTAVRIALTLAFGEVLGPALVPTVNVVGSFALGFVVGRLARVPVGPRTQAAQMFLGTGVLGGFTTYSALVLEASDPALLPWGIGSVVAGVLAALLGLRLGRGRRRA
ncbi:fluoride efflux transporter FluC [Microbacterium sp. P07]|uniref:fluoride efflux transporter FluC n=1 Tax=Microbacterium sp. P07 TaxID=3366952 RepID=UPI0037457117